LAMPSNWTRTTWGQLATLEYGKSLRGYKDVVAPFRVYGTNGPVGWHSEPLCERPGVIIGRKGAYRGIHYSSAPFFVIDTAFYLEPKADLLDPKWAYYQLLTVDINGMDSGSAIPSTSRDQFYKLPVLLPPRGEQEAIANVLMLLDDRIDLLRQTKDTLESIVRALFKSWFIDFDPVRAKAEGREPGGMAPETVALFPSAFEESSLGLIPKGWRVGDIYQVADVRYGAPFASKLFNNDDDGVPLVRIRDLKDEAPGVRTPEAHPKGHKIRPGDIVVGMDGEFRAYLWGGEVAWMNQRICMFSPKNGHSAAFVRQAIAAPLARVEATQTATTVIHLGKADIDRFRIVVPATDVARAFGALCQPLYDRIVVNKQAARLLGGLRDALLPRLISGKLRLPESRELIETVIA